MDVPHINGAIELPHINQAAPPEELHEPAALSLLNRALRFAGLQPNPRVDPAQPQENMSGPSYLPLWKCSKPTLDTVLDNWVAQAEEGEQTDRLEVVQLLKEAGARLKNGNIIIKKSLLEKDEITFIIQLAVGGALIGACLSLIVDAAVDAPVDAAGAAAAAAAGAAAGAATATAVLLACTIGDAERNINLRSYPSLTSLPDNLKVAGSLNLSGCINMGPQFLQTLSCPVLIMRDMNLDQVPESLERVQGLRQVNLNNNQIQALPDRLGQLPAGTEVFVEGNPIPAAEIARFRAAFLHITLRAGDQGGVNVHTRQMVSHFQTLYRNLDQVLREKECSLVSIDDTQKSLESAAKKYKTVYAQIALDAQTAIDYMLVKQRDITVIDFEGDVTSGKVLRSAWTLVQSQTAQEDRENGTENLLKHLAGAKGYCSTRHAEETLLALEDSYGSTLKNTAAEQKESQGGVDYLERELSTLDAIDTFLPDIKVFVKRHCTADEAISDDNLLEKLKTGLYTELAEKHPNVESLEETVTDVINHLALDWSTFVEMAKETE